MERGGMYANFKFPPTRDRCANEARLAVILEQQEFERDQLKQRGCGGNCGAK
jgi:hypothetical protein